MGSGVGSEDAAGKDPCAEAAATLEKLFRAGSKGVVHPVAGAAFSGSGEPDALDFKLGIEPEGEIHPLGEHVSTEGGRVDVVEAKCACEFREDLGREEGDLAFVVGFEVKEPVALDSPAGEAVDGGAFLNGSGSRGLVVVAEEVVGGGDEKPEHPGLG